MSRFKESTDWGGSEGVYTIDESCLQLHGGGDANWGDTEPDDATWTKARELAEKYGMVITSARLEWHGWGEMTPDPGDVSVFEWSPR